MAFTERDWNRLTETYHLSTQQYLDNFNGRRSFADRVRKKLNQVNNTFAKTGGEFMNENRAFGSKL